MTTMRWRIAVLALTVMVGAGGAWAQSPNGGSGVQGVQLNLSSPGARSLALGGAFIGLADDATAAFTNPAGLTTLSASEISIEGRSLDYSSVFLDGGHLFGEPTGIGIDTVSGPVFTEPSESVTSLSFLSYVYAGEGWAVAVYRHQLADYQMSQQTQGAYVGDPQTFLGRFFPTQGSLEVDIANYGLSAAVNLGESLTLGLGVSYYDFSLDSRVDRFDFFFGSLDGPGGPFGPPDFSPSNLLISDIQDGSDTDWGFNVGLLWRLSERFNIGLVYRDDPSFEFDARGVCGASDPEFCEANQAYSTTGTFNVPTVFGAGFAWRMTDAFTLTADWARVEWSNLLPYYGATLSEEDLRDFEIDDADEYHIGLEYVFTGMKYPLAVRLGTWLEPSHNLVYNGEDNLFFEITNLATDQIDDEWHYTGGLGLVIGSKFQIDAAFDMSEWIDVYSLSAVFRF